MPAVIEFNLPGLPQVHLRVRVYDADDVEVSLRNDDRPGDQSMLAVARARLADCYFCHDRLQPRFVHLWVGNTDFLVPAHEAETLRDHSQIPMLQEAARA